MTAVFLDLRGFTAFAETAEPEEVMRVLRDYQSLGKIPDAIKTGAVADGRALLQEVQH